MRRVLAWSIALALTFGACGEEPPALPEYCDEDPPASYGAPDRTEADPVQPPYRTITYTWLCIEGFYVQETWLRQDNGCWIQSDTYRTRNRNCP